MRVLFVTYPEKTIFQYLVPLAWALRTAGHDVRVASQPRFTGVITQAGLTAVPVGGDREIWRVAERKPAEVEASRAGLPEPYDVADAPEKANWDYLRAGYRTQVTWWHRMKNFPMIAELVSFARHWRPDLVLWEPTSYAGSIAAKAVGATHARLMYCLDIYGVTRDHYLRLKQQRQDKEDPLAEWLSGYAGKYGTGFSEDMITGHFTVDQLPESLRITADLDYVPMRYVPYGGPATVPAWLRTPPARPRVAFTLGLTATERFGGYTVDVQDVLDSLADLDIELVATLTGEAKGKLSRIPPNTRVIPYVPLHDLAATCSAVIHHAGAATLATTSLHGVPQLSIPFHFDQPALARKLTEQGAGLDIHSAVATGADVRRDLLRLLGEPGFRAGARRLRDEVLAMPTPNEIVPRLESLVAQR
ncbi:activator-dependent family glycosyltransferase [Kibdelosporangium phytohabitans]|uniref:Glycosyl transferase n=1 Tax=Kibdelosporangium phytohabitans TaxID=860235 RepID=A0A0N9HQN8_9PSEU|nr:activator-dependent family glycosyltransferase [Kibdelosporangium phytohabitans]ALG09445.1 glycosyl transferase [Kibdelosporangium phytohabitans]MBE1469268.1 glycosyltransferase (activator-dependent family) [Kibdelosporangium phytohabitans]